MGDLVSLHRAEAPRPDRSEIERWLGLWTTRHELLGGATGLRAVKSGEFRVLRPADVVGAVPWVAARSRQGLVAATVHPVALEHYVVGAPLRRGGGLATDWFEAFSHVFIDIDPNRPSRACATEEEQRHAVEVADAVESRLSEAGLPFARADSGNGVHLHLCLEPERAPDHIAAERRVGALLAHLKKSHSSAGAVVDAATYNLTRLVKVYGTPSAKGHAPPRRPRRLSRWHPDSLPQAVPLSDVVAALGSDEGHGRLAQSAPRPRGVGTGGVRSRRAAVVASFPLESVYGEFLTGRTRGDGWLECRDPLSPSGDRSPSAGVADGSGTAERGRFHSFRDGRNLSVFDFLIEQGRARNSGDAFGLLECGPSAPRAHSAPIGNVPPRPQPDRPIVDWWKGNEPFSSLAARLAEQLRGTGEVYRWNDGLAHLSADGADLRPISARALPGFLDEHLTIRRHSRGRRGGDSAELVLLPDRESRAFLEARQALQQLPRLHGVMAAPLILADWSRLSRKGYDPGSGWFVLPSAGVEPRDSTETLDDLLADFPFRSAGDRANVFGALLTAITAPHWGDGHPFVLLHGNKPGVGKTLLANLIALLVEGRVGTSLGWARDEELEKRLATSLLAGGRVILIDNVRTGGTLRSAVLERLVTSPSPSFRLLGSNREVRRDTNDLLVLVTINEAQLNADLRRRALPVFLESHEAPRQRRYRTDDLLAAARVHRAAALGELIGMVERWTQAGRPMLPVPPRHSAGQRWAGTIGSILAHAGVEGFLENLKLADEQLDPDVTLLAHVFDTLAGGGSAPAGELLDRLDEDLLAALGTNRRARATRLGQLLSNASGREIRGADDRFRIEKKQPRGSTHKPSYLVARELGDADDA